MNRKFLAMALATVFSLTLFAQQKTENCPKGGQENCTGICGRFTDENKDGYCDYSKLTDNRNLEQDKAKDEKIKAGKRQQRQQGNMQQQEHKCKHNGGDCKKSEGEKSCCKDKQVKEEKNCCKKEGKECKKAGEKSCCKNKQASGSKQCNKENKQCNKEKKDCCKDKK